MPGYVLSTTTVTTTNDIVQDNNLYVGDGFEEEMNGMMPLGNGNGNGCEEFDFLCGLVSYWNMEDLTIGSVEDLHGSNDGEKKDDNEPEETDGKIGEAQKFDGIDDYVKVANPTDLHFGTDGDFSVSVWAKRNEGEEIDPFRVMELGASDNWTTNNRRGWKIFYPRNHPSNTLQMIRVTAGYGDGSVQALVDTGEEYDYRDGEWHHIVVTFKRDGNLILYVDGELIGEDDMTDILNLDDTIYKDLYFGSNFKGDDRFLPGEIDEIGIWDRILSFEEVEFLYNKGDGLAYSDFEEEEELDFSMTNIILLYFFSVMIFLLVVGLFRKRVV